jgi:subtilisin family serine protease
MGTRVRALLIAATAVLALAAVAPASAEVRLVENHYIVLVNGDAEAAKGLVLANGGVVTGDFSRQIGMLTVRSQNPAFADALRSSPLVEEVANDLAWRAVPNPSGGGILGHPGDGPGAPAGPHNDTLEALQWDMRQIRTAQAHLIQGGSRAVDVGILDTGIDGDHVDFMGADGSNVDCARGRDFIPLGPGITVGTPCDDNNYHGTHVAGSVGARINGVGIVGVAPNVTMVPVKVCDVEGYCYASSTAAGITYAGDAKFDVINMSFYVDDDVYQQSHEFKCMNDPVQRAFRKANERAVQYARSQGVVPVAALGNSDNDLAHPPEPYENNCEVVPAETQGVIGTMSLGPFSEKARYSNYGVGATDVAAPGGNYYGPSGPTVAASAIPSTVPGGWAYAQGTSMASPHAAGVAALIVSQYGKVGQDGDVEMRPQQVEAHLQGTTIDIGKRGYDECFGNGRVDALRAVTHETRNVYEASPFCPEYDE